MAAQLEDIRITLNERVKELLDERDLSTDTFGENIGLSGSMVRKWCKSSALKLIHLLKVAEYFNCSVDFLCGRTEIPGQFYKSEVLFAEQLKSLIKQTKKPIDTISQKAGVARHNFYDWFKGMPPLSSSLIVLADYFDCTIDFLLGIEK